MANKDEHLSQALHNRDFWSSFDLDTSAFNDWVVTGIFYEGVHWVEAYLAKSMFHSPGHKERRVYMRRDIILHAISGDLEQLRIDSENARYRCYKHSKRDISNNLIPRVNQIKSYIESVI
jgi:hypothetical protein